MKLFLSVFSLILLTSCNYPSSDAQERFEDIYSQNISDTEIVEDPVNKDSTLVYTPKIVEETALPSFDQKQEATQSITLEIENNEGRISLWLLNPELKEIISARTWLAFPSNTLEIKNLNLNTDIFDLAAPNEYMVDTKNGIIKMGLTSTKKPRDPKIEIGSFNAENLSLDSVPLSCFDYGDYSDSHCMVLGEDEGNMLVEPEGIIIK
ncbi:hypothetical protein HON22_04235 [Candidatus Peregrinibacteria bacterium]|jgi:hypothetical protein|nr:hypothetical protein [Candidatus Peregrinibacteria bacterium]